MAVLSYILSRENIADITDALEECGNGYEYKDQEDHNSIEDINEEKQCNEGKCYAKNSDKNENTENIQEEIRTFSENEKRECLDSDQIEDISEPDCEKYFFAWMGIESNY